MTPALVQVSYSSFLNVCLGYYPLPSNVAMALCLQYITYVNSELELRVFYLFFVCVDSMQKFSTETSTETQLLREQVRLK